MKKCLLMLLACMIMVVSIANAQTPSGLYIDGNISAGLSLVRLDSDSMGLGGIKASIDIAPGFNLNARLSAGYQFGFWGIGLGIGYDHSWYSGTYKITDRQTNYSGLLDAQVGCFSLVPELSLLFGNILITGGVGIAFGTDLKLTLKTEYGTGSGSTKTNAVGFIWNALAAYKFSRTYVGIKAGGTIPDASGYSFNVGPVIGLRF